MEHLNREVRHDRGRISCLQSYAVFRRSMPAILGFDRSIVGAHTARRPRLRSYPAATSLLDLTETPAHTGVCLLVDKEEIGSGRRNRACGPAFSTPLYGRSVPRQDVNPRQVL